MKNLGYGVVLAMAVAATAAFAGDLGKHPKLKEAHESVATAKKSLAEANDKENSEFGGHRKKAQELLAQAQQEIVAAGEWADSHK